MGSRLEKSNYPLIGVVLLTVIALIALSLEVFVYPGVVFQKLGVVPWYFVVPSLIAVTLFRFILRQQFPKSIKNLVFFTAPVIVVGCVGVQVLEPMLNLNFFLKYFHIHPTSLKPLSLYASALLVLTLDWKFILQKPKWATLFFPAWLLALMVYFKWHFPFIFWFAEQEDSVTEYLTFFVYLLVAWNAWKIVKKIEKKDYYQKLVGKVAVVAFALATVVSVAIAGEEISWGQRIFGFETPEKIAEKNTQNEFNLHNQEKVYRFVYLAYAVLGLYGMSSWMVVGLAQKKMGVVGLSDQSYEKKPGVVKESKRKVTTESKQAGDSKNHVKDWLWLAEMFSPPWELMSFFFPIIAYSYLRQNIGSVFFDQWEELTELYLAIGVLLFVVKRERGVLLGESKQN